MNVKTFVCIRCLSAYTFGHDPVTGVHGLVSACECGQPNPGYFRGPAWVLGVEP